MTNKTIPIASTASLVCCAICTALFLTPLETHAQDGHHRYDDATQLWRLTENAAGLSIDHKRNRGYAEFDLQHTEGDYHRVQEGGMRNQLTFEAERYQAIGKHLVGYGRFNFGMDRTKDRAWADVMRPYLSNPFYGGSSVHGKYDTQSFDFSAAIATKPLFKKKKPVRSIERRKPRTLQDVLIDQHGKPLPKLREIPKREIYSYDDFDFPKTDEVEEGLRLGMRLDYRVGDLSRLRDPRSRSELLQYRLSPAATFTKGKSTVGLSGHYDRRKEKIPNMTTVQQDPNLMYYQMTGLGEATGLIGGYSGYQREWVNHELGAELTFGVHSSQFTVHNSQFSVHSSNAQPTLNYKLCTLNSIGIARGKEAVWGQYKYSPGQFTSYIYKVASRNRLRTDDIIHQLDIEAQWQQAYADEYRQQLIQEKDPEKGYTSYRYETQINYKKRQQLTTVDASLHYRLSFHDRNSITGYMGIVGQLTGSTTKHLLPSVVGHASQRDNSEQKLQRMNIALEGGHSFFDGRLWLDATATYSHASKADLTLADPTTEIATQVLVPDMDYYDADYRRGQLSLKYLFPLSLKIVGHASQRDKAHKNIFYVKAYGDIIKAQHSQDRKTVGLTFGLYN